MSSYYITAIFLEKVWGAIDWQFYSLAILAKQEQIGDTTKRFTIEKNSVRNSNALARKRGCLIMVSIDKVSILPIYLSIVYRARGVEAQTLRSYFPTLWPSPKTAS